LPKVSSEVEHITML